MSKIAAVMTGFHAKLYKAFGGRGVGEMKGVPMVVLTTTGRSSGKERDRPLMKIEHDGATHVIASAAGSDDHPQWYRNLRANPRVKVTDGGDTYAATAVVLDGDARREVYETAKGMMDDFAGYEAKADRTIPVIRLDRE